MFECLTALIIRILSNPLANLFQKKLTKTYPATLINLLAYAVLTLFCLYPLLNNNWAQYNVNYWGYVGLAGMLCTLGSICLIKALQYGELSVLGPINSYKCIVGLVLGVFMLGEIPNFIDILGIILIIWGSWYIFDTVKGGFNFKLLLRKDIILRFCALFFTGCEAVVLKKIILLSSVRECFILWCVSGFIFSLILMFLLKVKFERFTPKDFGQVALVSLSLGLMQYSTNIVFKHLQVSLSLALFQLSGLVTVLAGYFVFREGSLVKKLIATIIMITGSCLILL